VNNAVNGMGGAVHGESAMPAMAPADAVSPPRCSPSWRHVATGWWQSCRTSGCVGLAAGGVLGGRRLGAGFVFLTVRGKLD
jgi:hypothetical protein